MINPEEDRYAADLVKYLEYVVYLENRYDRDRYPLDTRVYRTEQFQSEKLIQVSYVVVACPGLFGDAMSVDITRLGHIFNRTTACYATVGWQKDGNSKDPRIALSGEIAPYYFVRYHLYLTRVDLDRSEMIPKELLDRSVVLQFVKPHRGE